MDFKYNVTGSERKTLVGAISEILGWEAVYKGAPTFAYAVNNYIINKGGTLICPTDVNQEVINQLVNTLKERGYMAEGADDTDSAAINEPLEETPVDIVDSNKLIVELPKDGFTDEAIQNLKKIISSKETIFKKAFGAGDLSVEITDGKLKFPWFTLSEAAGEMNAYTHFVCALCDMAKGLKRVTAKERDSGNDKFDMRLFLVRLGIKGPEHKTARKIILRNLTGNSSWKVGKRPEIAEITTRVGLLIDPKNNLEEMLADELLIHEVSKSFEEEN